MSDKPENPQAFSQAGMSLRDYFAGQYVAGSAVNWNGPTNHFAQRAYEYADALLKERAK